MANVNAAYDKYVNDNANHQGEIEQRAEDLMTLITAAASTTPYSLVLLDIVSSTLVGYWVREAAMMQAKGEPSQQAVNDALLAKVVTLCRVLMNEHRNEERPFCCDAHMAEHVAKLLLQQVEDPDAVLVLSDVMIDTLMTNSKASNYHMLDEVLEKLAKRQRRRCYELAYGKEEGRKLAQQTPNQG